MAVGERLLKISWHVLHPLMDDWVTRGLVGSLKIPITWVHEAKVRILALQS
jgi:hypothetical protein